MLSDSKGSRFFNDTLRNAVNSSDLESIWSELSQEPSSS